MGTAWNMAMDGNLQRVCLKIGYNRLPQFQGIIIIFPINMVYHGIRYPLVI